MKYVELNETINKKLFTKNERNNIINLNYNPLKVDCNINLQKRRDYIMKETKDILIKEINKELNFIEKIIFVFLRKSFIKTYKSGIRKGFNWENFSVR